MFLVKSEEMIITDKILKYKNTSGIPKVIHFNGAPFDDDRHKFDKYYKILKNFKQG